MSAFVVEITTESYLLAELRLVCQVYAARDNAGLPFRRGGLYALVNMPTSAQQSIEAHHEVTPLRANLEHPQPPSLAEVCTLVLCVIVCAEALSAHLSAL